MDELCLTFRNLELSLLSALAVAKRRFGEIQAKGDGQRIW